MISTSTVPPLLVSVIKLKKNYVDKQVIHFILEQVGYNKAAEVKEYDFQIDTHLHYLLGYISNLNAI